MTFIRVAPNVEAAEPVKVRTPTWLDYAACGSLGPDNHEDLALAFPATVEDARLFIRRYCAGCPVKQQCHDYAIRHNMQWGVYGGTVFGRDYLQETA